MKASNERVGSPLRGQAQVIPQDPAVRGEGFIKVVFGSELEAFTRWRIQGWDEYYPMDEEIPWEPGPVTLTFETQPGTVAPERLSDVQVRSGLLTIVVVSYTDPDEEDADKSAQ